MLEAQKAWEQVEPSTHTIEKVTLVLTRKKIVGISPVYDYIYRPSELEDMNLYQWVLQCERRKYQKDSCKTVPADDIVQPEATDENGVKNSDSYDSSCNSDPELTNDEEQVDGDHDDNDDNEIFEKDILPDRVPKNMHRFQKEHPLYETHMTFLKPVKPTAVVNFIGHILPRCDQGDREFYCLTMLTLFKPWRSGVDLKMKQKSWDETFNEHEFTKREKQLIRNFNIKYECFDARDDFRAQMKAGTTSNEWPINCFDGIDIDGEMDCDHDPYVDPNSEDLLKEPDIQKLCRSELNCQKEAGEIRDVLQRTGWLNETLNVTPCTDIIEVNSSSYLPAPTWKAKIQEQSKGSLKVK